MSGHVLQRQPQPPTTLTAGTRGAVQAAGAADSSPGEGPRIWGPSQICAAQPQPRAQLGAQIHGWPSCMLRTDTGDLLGGRHGGAGRPGRRGQLGSWKRRRSLRRCGCPRAGAAGGEREGSVCSVQRPRGSRRERIDSRWRDPAVGQHARWCHLLFEAPCRPLNDPRAPPRCAGTDALPPGPRPPAELPASTGRRAGSHAAAAAGRSALPLFPPRPLPVRGQLQVGGRAGAALVPASTGSGTPRNGGSTLTSCARNSRRYSHVEATALPNVLPFSDRSFASVEVGGSDAARTCARIFRSAQQRLPRRRLGA